MFLPLTQGSNMAVKSLTRILEVLGLNPNSGPAILMPCNRVFEDVKISQLV